MSESSLSLRSDMSLHVQTQLHGGAQVEDYYFSAAAGRARIVLGNRRLGENGFIASGRRQARPAAQVPSASNAHFHIVLSDLWHALFACMHCVLGLMPFVIFFGGIGGFQMCATCVQAWWHNFGIARSWCRRNAMPCTLCTMRSSMVTRRMLHAFTVCA